MIPNAVCRCLLALTAAGIVACGHHELPAGPDLNAAATIVVVPDSLRLLVNDTARVRAVVLNVQRDTLADAPIRFVSEDTTVAAIDSSGLVRARAGGVSDVSVRSGDVTGLLRVRVRVNGTLVVSPHVVFIESTDTVQLTVVVKDSTGAALPFASVQYRSRDSSVARVSSAGRVTFGGSAGSVMIEVISAGRTDGAFVTALVKRVPTGEARVVRARGSTAFTIADDALQRIDLVTGTLTQDVVLGQTYFDDLALNGSLTRAYLADHTAGQIVVADLVNDTVGHIPVASPFYGPRALALGPGDSVLFFAADSHFYRLNLKSLTATPVLQCGYRSEAMVAHDSMLYGRCVNRAAPYVDLREYNMRSNTAGRVLATGGGGGPVALSPNGQRLYSYDFGSLKVRDLVSGDSLAAIPVTTSAYGVTAIAVQPVTGLVWLSSSFDARVYVVDPTTGHVIRTLQPGGNPLDIAFGSSGTGVIANPNVYPASTHWIDLIR